MQNLHASATFAGCDDALSTKKCLPHIIIHLQPTVLYIVFKFLVDIQLVSELGTALAIKYAVQLL
jgi:hypothetical protein